MKKLYIIKVGTTFASTANQFGDFDQWIISVMGEVSVELATVDAEHGASLPLAGQCAGVVITGSHSMVTDNLPWSLKLEEWIMSLITAETPLLGICYGHQLLARSAGGKVGYHPQGKEIGTVSVYLHSDCDKDPLFYSLPQSFSVHVTHDQTVLNLPSGAICLAANTHESNHAFRLGEFAWGVQFHPEYNTAIMHSYIEEQADELKSSGVDIDALQCLVTHTSDATNILKNFARFVEEQVTKN